MSQLRFPFTRDRYVHRLLERAGDVCLVERMSTHPDSAGSVHWEVVRLVAEPAKTLYGRAYDAHERYPSSEQWGERGWTYRTRADAQRKYRSLAQSKAQEAGSDAEGDPEPTPPDENAPVRAKREAR